MGRHGGDHGAACGEANNLGCMPPSTALDGQRVTKSATRLREVFGDTQNVLAGHDLGACELRHAALPYRQRGHGILRERHAPGLAEPGVERLDRLAAVTSTSDAF